MKGLSARASDKDRIIVWAVPTKLVLQQALELIDDHELADAIPHSICLRKKVFSESDRNRCERSKV